MRLILLLSFVLPGFLVTVADLPPDYEYENNEVVLDDDDWLYDDDDDWLYGDEDALDDDDALDDEDTIYYEDSSSEMPVVPKNKDIRGDEKKTPEFKGIEAADLKDNADGVVSGAEKQLIGDRANINGNKYGDSRKHKYPKRYLGRNNLHKDIPISHIKIIPKNTRISTHDSGMTDSGILSRYAKSHNRAPCREGYQHDSRGRCRMVLR